MSGSISEGSGCWVVGSGVDSAAPLSLLPRIPDSTFPLEGGQGLRPGDEGLGRQRGASQGLLVQLLPSVRLESCIPVLPKGQSRGQDLCAWTRAVPGPSGWGLGEPPSPGGCCDLRSLPGSPLASAALPLSETACPETVAIKTRLHLVCHFILLLTNLWLISPHTSEKRKNSWQMCTCVYVNHSVVSDSLWPRGL